MSMYAALFVILGSYTCTVRCGNRQKLKRYFDFSVIYFDVSVTAK